MFKFAVCSLFSSNAVPFPLFCLKVMDFSLFHFPG